MNDSVTKADEWIDATKSLSVFDKNVLEQLDEDDWWFGETTSQIDLDKSSDHKTDKLPLQPVRENAKAMKELYNDLLKNPSHNPLVYDTATDDGSNQEFGRCMIIYACDDIQDKDTGNLQDLFDTKLYFHTTTHKCYQTPRAAKCDGVDLQKYSNGLDISIKELVATQNYKQSLDKPEDISEIKKRCRQREAVTRALNLTIDEKKVRFPSQGELAEGEDNFDYRRVNLQNYSKALDYSVGELASTLPEQNPAGEVEIQTKCVQQETAIRALNDTIKDKKDRFPGPADKVESDEKSVKGIRDTIQDEIEASQKDAKYNEYKMFVLIIIAHGNDGFICGPHGETIQLADIYKMLSGFEALRRRPKWVIVNSCTGSEFMPVDRYAAVSDKSKTRYPQPPSVPSFKRKVRTEDISVWFATFPGYVSYAYPDGGAWFIRAIIYVMHKHSHHMHLQEMFTLVQDKVREYSIKRSDSTNVAHGQQPVTICTFPKGKRVYLFPGLNRPRVSANNEADDNNTANTVTTKTT